MSCDFTGTFDLGKDVVPNYLSDNCVCVNSDLLMILEIDIQNTGMGILF